MAMQLRPYQIEAIEAVNQHLATEQDNPVIVLPTGSGKSLVMASMLHAWIEGYPAFRACVLAHRKELVEQNAAELMNLDPWLSVGIYAAALNRRETRQSITFASIDSIYNKANLFDRFDIIIVDEAHRIPVRGEGKYRRFISDVQARNPKARVVGLTATPYRMGSGLIYHSDFILNTKVYEANVGDLIRDGYLSPLRSVRNDTDYDLSQVKKGAGDFNQRSLAEIVDTTDVVSRAVNEMVQAVRANDRKSTIVFCINIEHCKNVARELKKHGIDAPWIVGTTPMRKRERLVNEFRAGRLPWLLSVDCFFEGFNARCVDCVIMLRPTQSKGIWVQAVGRGLRLSPETGKQDCLVLDFGQNIDRHGPIDIDEDQQVKLHDCHNCGNAFARALGLCPSCKVEIPKRDMDFYNSETEKERKLHNAVMSQGALLNEPHWLDVTGISINLHVKLGSPDSVRITYHCGLRTIHEWVCIDHEGYAGVKARKWLKERDLPYGSVSEMMDDQLIARQRLHEITKRIQVRYEGKYLTVIDYDVEEFTLES